MAIRNYDGMHGKFQYDDSEFMLDDQYFVYIGSETDGSKIKIPDGITSIRYMFKDNRTLITPPAIPPSVTDCQSAFEKCVNLENGAVIPDGVVNAQNMYKDCYSIREISPMPDTVENCFGMLYNCRVLESVPHISLNAKNCSRMVSGCISLQKCADIPDGVLDCTGMFESCQSVKCIPAIPESVKECRNMFTDDTPLIKALGKWQLDHRGETLSSSLEQYYSDDVLNRLGSDSLFMLVDIARKYEESDKNAVYKSVISMINQSQDLDKERIMSALETSNRIYMARCRRLQEKEGCKVPSGDGETARGSEVTESYVESEAEISDEELPF